MNFNFEIIDSAQHNELWQRGYETQAGWTGQELDSFWLAHIEPCYTAGMDLRRTDLPDTINGLPVHRSRRAGGLTYYGVGQLHVCTIVELGRLGLTGDDFTRTVLQSLQTVLSQHAQQELQYNLDDPGIFTAQGDKVASLGFSVNNANTVCIGGIVINYSVDLSGFDGIEICGRQRSMKNISQHTLSWPQLVRYGREIVFKLTGALYHDQQSRISSQGTGE